MLTTATQTYLTMKIGCFIASVYSHMLKQTAMLDSFTTAAGAFFIHIRKCISIVVCIHRGLINLHFQKLNKGGG